MWRILTIIFLLIYLICNDVLSQTVQADTIYNKPYDWRVGQRDTLPDWIFIPQKDGVVIAMSDPCMEPEAARKQALQRASYLFSLQQNAPLKLLSDFYSHIETNIHDNERNKILRMGVITQPVSHDSYRVEREYTSLFGEKFLQVSFVVEDSSKILSNSITELMLLFTKETFEEEEVKFNLFLEADCKDFKQMVQTRYEIKGNPERPEISSYMNGVSIDSFRKDYWYADKNGETEEYNKGILLKNSFWNAYMLSLVKSVLQYPFSSVNIKRVGDNFIGNNGMNQALSREKLFSTISIYPCIQMVKENRLSIDWRIVEH